MTRPCKSSTDRLPAANQQPQNRSNVGKAFSHKFSPNTHKLTFHWSNQQPQCKSTTADFAYRRTNLPARMRTPRNTLLIPRHTQSLVPHRESAREATILSTPTAVNRPSESCPPTSMCYGVGVPNNSDAGGSAGLSELQASSRA